MEVVTLRLDGSTLEALDDEYEEFGFENRTAYIRHLIDRARQDLDDGSEYVSGEPTAAQLDAMAEEIVSVRAAIADLQGEPAGPTGPVEPPGPATPGDAPAARVDGVEDIDLPGHGVLEEHRREAVQAVYDRLREQGSATKQELLDVVDADAVGYQDVESFWSNVIPGRDTLSRLPGVEPPGQGGQTWRYVDGE